MKQGDLVFKELIARRDAIHSLLVNADKLAVELRGVATDNQAQIGDALKQLDTALTFLRGREKQIDDDADEPRPLRLDPDQHHRHRPLVRRLRAQPRQHRRPRRVQAGEEAEVMNRSVTRTLAVAAAVVLLAATFFVFQGGDRDAARSRRTSTAR